MEKIISFICENWKLIAYCFITIICLVSALVRKKPVKVVDSVKEDLLMVIPSAINAAEEYFGSGHGKEKFEDALLTVKNYFEEHYPKCCFDVYRSFIVKNIEHILSTPQKKGD